MSQYGLYPKFYVKRKNILFPLIEKYSGISLKGKSHGAVVQIYEELLRSNDAFIGEVDALIAKQGFKNADGYRNGGSVTAPGTPTSSTRLPTSSTRLPTSSTSGSGGGIKLGGAWTQIISGALDTTGSIFGFLDTKRRAEAQEDQQLYDVILNEQKKDDTMKILVVSGITLAFIGLGVFMVIKFRK
jgi:hypothetical protein